MIGGFSGCRKSWILLDWRKKTLSGYPDFMDSYGATSKNAPGGNAYRNGGPSVRRRAAALTGRLPRLYDVLNRGRRGARLERRFWRGFQDLDNKKADRAIAADDVSQMLNIAAAYELPFGSSRRFMNRAGVFNHVVWGWVLTANFMRPPTALVKDRFPGAESVYWLV